MKNKADRKTSARKRSEAGFTLIETMIAIMVLVIGILGIAAVLANGLAFMNVNQYDYIAQQKAAQAVESIFTARDMGQATWASICNVGSSVCCAGSASACTGAGIFLVGAQSLCDPGADGIVGTSDDNCNTLADAILVPGSGGNFNPPARVPLSNYQFLRTITITSVVDGGGNTIANLRQIQVTITYRVGRFPRQYALTTYISNFS